MECEGTDQNYHQFLPSKLTLQSQFHIYSNLINSYRKKARHFYFLTKYNLKDQVYDEDSGNTDFEKLRKTKQVNKDRILKNEKFVKIV